MIKKKTVIGVVRLFNNVYVAQIGQQIGGEQITVIINTYIIKVS